MELQTAIEILEYHQEWRLGKREDMIHEPKKLTEAFDLVLREVKKFRLGATRCSLPEHECRYCGAMTTQPDEECYRAPSNSGNEA